MSIFLAENIFYDSLAVLPYGVAIVDAQGVIHYLNKCFKNIFEQELSKSIFQHDNIKNIFTEEVITRLYQNKDNKFKDLEVELGENHTYELTLKSLAEHNELSLLIMRNISHRKNNEKLKSKSLDSLRKKFKASQERILKLNNDATLAKAYKSLAHDLKNTFVYHPWFY